jgi:short-subunit dehydrogenase
MELQGKFAVVTGASAGIGAALARALVSAGCGVLLTARREDRLEELAQELRQSGGDARTLGVDLLADDAAEQILAAAPEASILINNAGAGLFGPALDHEPAAQARLVRLNCESLTALSLAFAARMTARGEGVVVNLASIAGFQPVPYFAVYAATKAYVLSLSEALDIEWAEKGVRVVAVCPGPVPTEFQQIAGSPDAHPTPKLALRTPEQVAEATVKAIRSPKRVVTPAPVHSWMQWAQRFVPRGFVLKKAARSMLKRIEDQGEQA